MESDHPAGRKHGALNNTTAVKPTFTADIAGIYVAQLIVNDGTDDSAPRSTVTINGRQRQYRRLSRHAGPNQTVKAGATVILNGSGSNDVDGDPLTFSWTLTTPPDRQQRYPHRRHHRLADVSSPTSPANTSPS